MLIAFNKPFGVLSQFTDEAGHAGLKRYIPFPGVYAAGRLDHDSEGLLLLTDDAALASQIMHPRHKWRKSYLVQVEGEISDSAVQKLRGGVMLKDGPARALLAEVCEPPKWLWPRYPPIRERKAIPTSWLRLQLGEGRNRQVRRMTAAVAFPTLRLIREQIGPHHVEAILPGQYQQLSY